MSELITDPLTGRRVVFAPDRAERPNEFRKASQPVRSDTTVRSNCPFCPGNESQTPDAILQLGPTNAWRCRVFANKYPLCAPPDAPAGLTGVHEVIIESQQHLQRTGELGEQGLAEVLQVYAMRLQHWRDDPRYPFRLLFKNVGASGGASLSHLHSQFLALPHLSAQLETERRLLSQHPHPSRAWPHWLADQLADQQQQIAENQRFVIFCPRASRSPLETWVMPKERSPWYEQETDWDSLSRLLLPVVTRIEQLIAPAGYNMALHTAPTTAEYADRMHWRLEIIPRVASLAGFELATGLYLNTVPAAQAAALLRG